MKAKNIPTSFTAVYTKQADNIAKESFEAVVIKLFMDEFKKDPTFSKFKN